MSNVGEDKDTLKRQRAAVYAFAKAASYHIVAEYSDDGVKGADPVDQRAGFAGLLKHRQRRPDRARRNCEPLRS